MQCLSSGYVGHNPYTWITAALQIIAFFVQPKEPMATFHPIKNVCFVHIVQDQPINIKGFLLLLFHRL